MHLIKKKKKKKKNYENSPKFTSPLYINIYILEMRI